MRTVLTLVAALALAGGLAGSMRAAKHGAENKDEAALVQLEEEWLHAHDLATLERIYAREFVHIRSDGRIFTREEDLANYRKMKAPPEAGLHRRFEELKVRMYGTLGIANGRTAVTDESGKTVRETSFTDVFVRRSGRWKAINAQETPVKK
jgi:Domain of unknown function (DUF4440)